MYRTDVYFITKNLAEMPFTTFLPFVFTGISYYMIGLYQPAENFFICTAILILVANTAVSYGYLLSCLAKDINMALALAAPLLIPLMLFGGFFLNSGTVPNYFIWIKYISWFNYGNEALMINQWKDVEFINCTQSGHVVSDDECLNDGQEVLELLSYKTTNMGFDIGLLFVLIVAFRLVAFLLLLNKTKRKTVKVIDE
ncbi:hypothetical protein Pmani_021647 [Petrolisthes manimaculis]|uniref:ABC-2 type transporter transmembrane domain-containing protein n=1 Tax=Petrolisthes manimaculis TaxID=1843537 RepID=A0AAE1U533_9EUCA|nr:hypothetical protein Pmani_021647 [Petrolisthes manimaculis]